MRVTGTVARPAEAKQWAKEGRSGTVASIRVLDESTAQLIEVTTFEQDARILGAKTGDRFDEEVRSLTMFREQVQATIADPK